MGSMSLSSFPGRDLASAGLEMNAPALDAEVLKHLRSGLTDLQGVPMTLSVTHRWDDIKNFSAHPDDLLIATYPKSGTTWMVEIVDSIRNEGISQEMRSIPSLMRAPFLEMNPPAPFPSGLDILKTMPAPRMVKTHLPFQLVPQSFWDNNCKAIYIARNAKDVLISYYYFHKMNTGMPEPGTWHEFFDNFLSGKVSWGSWFDHVTGWWDAREGLRIHYVFYEDLKQDPVKEIKKVALFLGKTLNKELLDTILEHTSFNKMKDNPMTNFSTVPPFVFKHDISPFMRKGTVGDWKLHLTVAENERFDEEYQRRMAASSLTFRTEL
ncbi:sulfotransferase 1C2-like isoform X2 [Erpetoichthys calabaricus]|uniref:sulfotransferase 1C2-like isoform X2 n=1 Tax=Erpetoichthys calabaricus TaxID=27687 RepID=UPI002233FF04|nr:sulfotransferase 1C2-like isoform X2 [Erpetoichthys calabaricus]